MKLGMVGGLNDELVSHGRGAELKSKGLDDTLLLGHVA